MKYTGLLLIALLITVGCSKEIPSELLVERDGITYEVNSQKPFRGISVNYYNNTQLMYRKNFKDGVQNGLDEEYSENGALIHRYNFKDGVLDGPQETYFENGQLEVKAIYKDGLPDGPMEGYSENGHLDFILYMKGDKIVSREFYDENGELIEYGSEDEYWEEIIEVNEDEDKDY